MTFLAHNEDAMVYSYKLNEDEWAELKKKSDLKLGCCGGRAVFKITKDGVRYFDHEKTEKNCGDSVDVSGEYLTTKSKLIDILSQRGWRVESDKKTKKWSADIYAENDLNKLCIYIRTIEPSLNEIERLDKVLAKEKIKSLWFVKFKNNTRTNSTKYYNARENITKYNNKANVLELIKKKDEVRVSGFFSIKTDNGTHVLDQIEDLELSEFIRAFFIEKRIKRHKIGNNLMFNFEHNKQKCSKCKNHISGVISINVAILIDDTPVRVTGVFYEQIEDKVVFSNINKYAREKHLGFGLTWVLEYRRIEEVDVAIQYCLYCYNRFKTSSNSKEIARKTEYMPTRLRHTDIGSRFGAIWIISPSVEVQ